MSNETPSSPPGSSPPSALPSSLNAHDSSLPAEIKSCCAALYETDWAQLLLGSSLHPGGLALTDRLGTLLDLDRNAVVLDAACGPGTSAVFLARSRGCRVIGVDLGEANLARARAAAEEAGVASLVELRKGDAEGLPVDDAAVDAVICECAFCTFPDKQAAAAEFARVLRPGGRAGLSDLTRNGPLPAGLDGLLAWVACLGDARPLHGYEEVLRDAGFDVMAAEPHDEALIEMASDIRRTLTGAELASKLGMMPLPAMDLDRGKQLARAAEKAVRDGLLGYALLAAVKQSM